MPESVIRNTLLELTPVGTPSKECLDKIKDHLTSEDVPHFFGERRIQTRLGWYFSPLGLGAPYVYVRWHFGDSGRLEDIDVQKLFISL